MKEKIDVKPTAAGTNCNNTLVSAGGLKVKTSVKAGAWFLGSTR